MFTWHDSLCPSTGSNSKKPGSNHFQPIATPTPPVMSHLGGKNDSRSRQSLGARFIFNTLQHVPRLITPRFHHCESALGCMIGTFMDNRITRFRFLDNLVGSSSELGYVPHTNATDHSSGCFAFLHEAGSSWGSTRCFRR
jgi:hypothetical protein